MLIKYICTYFFLCVPFRALYNQRIGNYSQKTEDGSRLRPRRQPANCVAYLWGSREEGREECGEEGREVGGEVCGEC